MNRSIFFFHNKFLNFVFWFLAGLSIFGLVFPGQLEARSKKATGKSWPQNIQSLIGDGAVLVMDHHAPPSSQELYAYNAGRAYVPASILKIVTIGAALEFLGPDFRFKTDFLLTKNHDLWVVGYGDPYIVSQELVLIVKALKERGLTEVKDIYLDNSYFEKDIILDGNTQTASAYDAYNLAFGVNFNTVLFKKQRGKLLRADGHTPLTPLAREMSQDYKGPGTYRINIPQSPNQAEIHSGQTLQAHLEEAGIPVKGEIITGQIAPPRRKVFYRHASSRSLEETLRDLMKYSNNFMSNQIFLALGAQLYGAPGNRDKSQKVMDAYFQKYSLDPIMMGDGSGLSRTTTLTARQMVAILEVVEPDRYLFTPRDNGQIYVKTGTMSDIKTLAGFIERPGEPDSPLSFVILLNGPNYTGRSRAKILKLLQKRFTEPTPSAGQ